MNLGMESEILEFKKSTSELEDIYNWWEIQLYGWTFIR